MSSAVDSISVLATGTPLGATAPDSIAIGGGHIWVAYTNGASSTGAAGSPNSTVAEYTKAGNLVHSFSLPGYVDGLKVDPATGDVWALQNQDGNSTLTLIEHGADNLVGPLAYADPSPTQGYDDVVFQGSTIYMSRTNPNPGDPVIVTLSGGNEPTGPLAVTDVFFNGATGTDTVTGVVGPVPLNDPDSLKTAPNGDLLLTSGDDGTIIDIHNIGPSQSVTFTPVTDASGSPVSGLDDVIQTTASSGTFYIADGADDRVLAVHVSDLNPNDYYASVGSLNEFGEVDPTTGVFTPLVSASNAPGGEFGSPHGVWFVADTPAGPHSLPFAATHASNNIVLGHSLEHAFPHFDALGHSFG
jgi:hypothetical protein